MTLRAKQSLFVRLVARLIDEATRQGFELTLTRSSVQRLFARRSPTAVARLVMTFIIYAINRAPRWTRSHIGEERHEIITPPLTHGNASPSVVSKVDVSWVEATTFRVCPCFVRTRALGSLPPMAVAVIGTTLTVFCFQAPATFCVPVSKVGLPHGHAATAGTNAYPLSSKPPAGIRNICGTLDDRQASEGVSNEINEFPHLTKVSDLATFGEA